ncbi:protein involved in the processing of pre-rRNA to mature rRNA [Saccharomyces cerevisiae]|nr:protein involved in the processing of pre-rRNA to mature rRNA [Saccharomyces cerevisiae]
MEKTLLLNREIDDWKSNDKKKAYKERGRVYASCSFIEVSFSQIRAVDVEKKIENAEQLRDLTRNIVKNKTSSLNEITPSKNRVISACNSERPKRLLVVLKEKRDKQSSQMVRKRNALNVKTLGQFNGVVDPTKTGNFVVPVDSPMEKD